MQNNIETITTDILKKFDMYDKLPVYIKEIAIFSGVDICDNKKIDVFGAIRQIEHSSRYRIIVDKNLGKNFKRFAIARLLGVAVLYPEKLTNYKMFIYNTTSATSSEDKILDAFARAILVNKDALLKLYEVQTSISALAKVFQVSSFIIEDRLKDLKLI